MFILYEVKGEKLLTESTGIVITKIKNSVREFNSNPACLQCGHPKFDFLYEDLEELFTFPNKCKVCSSRCNSQGEFVLEKYNRELIKKANLKEDWI